ncbi:hypothetical protein ES319_A04G052400v1 [Gossypium barbadense]|uniref:Uncharacterized protein n=2 Tax=Gossypium TaxID=3633 RepID=A0A5J5W3U5_GOSBA|nr:hypothetical protein ES319_A04G052400v1 [Gossypium barbadense]KAB2086710.1 hypothetical protein ES319_A04G052400v1 [Gossypium barbadense]TYH21622.1 hypothetical protein ES288_A04G059800v1 [Gossypium darwinii]
MGVGLWGAVFCFLIKAKSCIYSTKQTPKNPSLSLLSFQPKPNIPLGADRPL